MNNGIVTELVVIHDSDELEDRLMAMNEAGIDPAIPFVDAWGNANLAMGQAPSGDDWQIGFVTQEPDSGVLAHCCECYGHEGVTCDLPWHWEPTYPIAALVKRNA